jgi:hypothetical protein
MTVNIFIRLPFGWVKLFHYSVKHTDRQKTNFCQDIPVKFWVQRLHTYRATENEHGAAVWRVLRPATLIKVPYDSGQNSALKKLFNIITKLSQYSNCSNSSLCCRLKNSTYQRFSLPPTYLYLYQKYGRAISGILRTNMFLQLIVFIMLTGIAT